MTKRQLQDEVAALRARFATCDPIATHRRLTTDRTPTQRRRFRKEIDRALLEWKRGTKDAAK